jgi:signal transduction histidine kinase
MSHEIRTPMMAVIGFAGVLTELLEVPEQREYAESILKSGSRLLTTINSILDLAKIEANRYDLQAKATNVAGEIQRIVAMLEPLAREKNLRLDYSIAADFPLLYVDEYAIGQILTNLIGNAIKFTKEGNVFINTGITEEYCFAEVIDTGIGISPDFLPYVFDEFRQESGGLDRNFEGTGLGLAISKKVSTLMGIDLTASSELGVGSSFRLCFPKSIIINGLQESKPINSSLASLHSIAA